MGSALAEGRALIVDAPAAKEHCYSLKEAASQEEAIQLLDKLAESILGDPVVRGHKAGFIKQSAAAVKKHIATIVTEDNLTVPNTAVTLIATMDSDAVKLDAIAELTHCKQVLLRVLLPRVRLLRVHLLRVLVLRVLLCCSRVCCYYPICCACNATSFTDSACALGDLEFAGG